MPRRIDEDKLLAETVAVFVEHGYQATTTAEIARRSGVGEVTLFRRYGAKAALINTALKYALARPVSARIEVTDDVAADLVALVRMYTERTDQYGAAAFAVLTDVTRHPELRESMDELMVNLTKAAELIAAHQERGHLVRREPMQMLTVLLAPIMMHGLWSRTGALPIAPYDPEALVGAFLDGHRPQ
jgi:AcrR family transcriptional regulator